MSLFTAFHSSKAPMLYVLAAFIVGIIAYDFCGIYCALPVIFLVWLSLLCLGAVSVFMMHRHRARYRILFAAFFISCTGFALCALQDVRQSPDWIGHDHAGAYETLIVEVSETPKEKKATHYIPVSIIAGRDSAGWHTLSGHIRMYVYKDTAYQLQGKGAVYQVPNHIQVLPEWHNPFAVNYVRQQQRSGYYHQLFVRAADLYLVRPSGVLGTTGQVKHKALQYLEQYIPDTMTAALVKATLLNASEDELDGLREAYTHTGIMHIIAISGMHVNLLFMILVLPFFRIRDPRKLWIKYIAVLPFVWIYIALCDYPPSAIRAALSFTLLTIALCTQRAASPLQLWALTAMALFCIQPMWLYHIGVQLSLLAVLSILLFFQPIRNWFYFSNAPLRLLWDSFALSLSVQVLVAPLILYYFHQFPVWFLPANVLAALFSVLLMGLSLLLILLALLQLSSWAGIAGKILVSCTRVFHTVIDWLDAYTPDAAHWLPLDGWDYVLLMLSIILLAIFCLKHYGWTLPAGMSMLLLLVLNLIIQDMLAAKQQHIIVYAAGKETLIDHINGRTSCIYSNIPPSPEQEQYILRPAHLGYRVQEEQQAQLLQTREVFLSGKRIVWASATELGKLRSGMDVLILSGCAPVADMLQAQPRQVVLAGSCSKRSADAMYAGLEARGVVVHNVGRDGAWIFSK